MDKRIILILKTIALEVVTDDDGSTECAFECGGKHNYKNTPDRFDIIAHKPTCETLIARTLLREQGMLIYGYRIISEIQKIKGHGGWHTIVTWDKAFSEQEIRDKYATYTTMEWVYRRNFKFECVREM